jgi:hypothetical protein
MHKSSTECTGYRIRFISHTKRNGITWIPKQFFPKTMVRPSIGATTGKYLYYINEEENNREWSK